MYNSQKKLIKDVYISINLPEDNFFNPSDKKCKNDLICILQNQFLDQIKQFQLISYDKLEEFRYLCESYFDNLNQIDEGVLEEDYDERYL